MLVDDDWRMTKAEVCRCCYLWRMLDQGCYLADTGQGKSSAYRTRQWPRLGIDTAATQDHTGSRRGGQN
jgi:beta-lactamase superfamily II metal-dependent hydrolase